MKHLSVLASILALAIACGGAVSVPLETTPRTPAAIGVVDVKQGPNHNTVGKLRVEHLAPPGALRSDLTVYVAWVRPVGAAQWQNVGQLLVGESREGVLEMRVAQDQFELSVSAESDGSVTRPSEFVVMRGQVDSRNAS
jgi:hypothetical protein